MNVVITVEKAPKKLFVPLAPLFDGAIPDGTTALPKKRTGFQKIEILIQEKMSQYSTRVALAHELFHCLQYLTNCEEDESTTYEISEVMVRALKEKRKKRG